MLQSNSPSTPPPSLDSMPVALSLPPTNTPSTLRTEELDEPPSRPPGMRAILPLAGETVLTAGSDCAIRLWEPSRPDRCEIVCAPAPIGATAPLQHYDVRQIKGVGVLQEVHSAGQQNGHYSPACYAPNLRSPATGSGALSAAASHLSGGTGRMDAHRDCINDMAIVEGAQRLLITACRDGVVKAWK